MTLLNISLEILTKLLIIIIYTCFQIQDQI